MEGNARVLRPVAQAIAAGLGLVIAAIDVAAPFGDDSSQFTVFLWLVSSGLFGFAMPQRPWRWAVLIGPMLPLTYLILRVAGRLPRDDRNGYLTYLILIPVSLAACLLGCYVGAAARRLVMPPSSAPETIGND
ncbi:MAG: hypothetical protein ACHRXM_34085 [Isosphaerales bacterium]